MRPTTITRRSGMPPPKRLDRNYWSEPYFDEGGGRPCDVHLLARVAQRRRQDVRHPDGGHLARPSERAGEWHQTLSRFLHADDKPFRQLLGASQAGTHPARDHLYRYIRHDGPQCDDLGRCDDTGRGRHARVAER